MRTALPLIGLAVLFSACTPDQPSYLGPFTHPQSMTLWGNPDSAMNQAQYLFHYFKHDGEPGFTRPPWLQKKLPLLARTRIHDNVAAARLLQAPAGVLYEYLRALRGLIPKDQDAKAYKKCEEPERFITPRDSVKTLVRYRRDLGNIIMLLEPYARAGWLEGRDEAYYNALLGAYANMYLAETAAEANSEKLFLRLVMRVGERTKAAYEILWAPDPFKRESINLETLQAIRELETETIGKLVDDPVCSE